MFKKDLLNRTDIRNAFISVINKSNFPTNNDLLNEVNIFFQYNSKLESGGHESLLRWQS